MTWWYSNTNETGGPSDLSLTTSKDPDAMSVSEITAELDSRGIDYSQCYGQKSLLAERLAKARERDRASLQDVNIVSQDEENLFSSKEKKSDTPQKPPRPKRSCCDTTPKRIAWGLLGLTVVITAIILLVRSLQKLDSTEYGLEYNTHNKKLAEAAKTGGLHAGPPGFEFIKFPSTFVTEDLPDATCVSRDGLRVEFSVTFQYQMPSEWLKQCILKYRDFEKWAKVVAAAGNSAVQHTCSEFEISNFQNQRGIIQGRMEENLRTKLEGPSGMGEDGVFARAISLQLREIELPEEYQDAVAEKQAAAEDIELAKNQRTQETTKAETKLLSAREQARKIIDSAVNDANVTLTEAGLKVEETLFAYETEAAVIVRVKETLNLTTDGVLAYLANQLYASVPSLKVSAGEPAKLSRKDEL